MAEILNAQPGVSHLILDNASYGSPLSLSREQAATCGSCYFRKTEHSAGTICDFPRYLREDDVHGLADEFLTTLQESGKGVPLKPVGGVPTLQCPLGVVKGKYVRA